MISLYYMLKKEIKSSISKNEFLSTLKQVIKHQAKKKTSPCRCASCYNERQKNQRKTGGASLK